MSFDMSLMERDIVSLRPGRNIMLTGGDVIGLERDRQAFTVVFAISASQRTCLPPGRHRRGVQLRFAPGSQGDS